MASDLALCEPILLNEVPVGHVLLVETPAGKVTAVVHPLTLSDPARRALGVAGDVVQVVVDVNCDGMPRRRATLMSRGDDVIMALLAIDLSYRQADALAKALYGLLTWDDPDAVAEEVSL